MVSIINIKNNIEIFLAKALKERDSPLVTSVAFDT